MTTEIKIITSLSAVIIFILILAAFGKGCGSDEDVDRQLKKNQEQIDRLQQERDSLEREGDILADSIRAYQDSVLVSDEARARAEYRTRRALDQLANLPRYETLTHDALARRADSLYVHRSTR
jgi:cell division protein FtsB